MTRLDRKGQDTGLIWWKRKKNETGRMKERAENKDKARWTTEKFLSNFLKVLDFKIKDFKYFQTKFELRPN
jgi:hypothetical protein